MLKRCLSPLTLVNQVALIVMLSTAIGVAGMAVSGWLVQGVQGSAHAINKAGSLRMQSYRLLAAVPLSVDDQKLLNEMEQTAFSPELTRAAERDGQQEQLRALQDYWHRELSPDYCTPGAEKPSPPTLTGSSPALISSSPRLITPPKCALNAW